MDACLGVEREVDKVLVKLKEIDNTTLHALNEAIKDIEALKQGIETGEYSVPGINTILNNKRKRVVYAFAFHSFARLCFDSSCRGRKRSRRRSRICSVVSSLPNITDSVERLNLIQC